MTSREYRYVSGRPKPVEEHDKLDVKVFSAINLSPSQRSRLESKLERVFDRKINMILRVDPSLLGGLRIVAEHTVIDNTIKTRIADMKKNIYRGVFFK